MLEEAPLQPDGSAAQETYYFHQEAAGVPAVRRILPAGDRLPHQYDLLLMPSAEREVPGSLLVRRVSRPLQGGSQCGRFMQGIQRRRPGRDRRWSSIPQGCGPLITRAPRQRLSLLVACRWACRWWRAFLRGPMRMGSSLSSGTPWQSLGGSGLRASLTSLCSTSTARSITLY
jgi:hypothetical protein